MYILLFTICLAASAYHIRFLPGSFVKKDTYENFLEGLQNRLQTDSFEYMSYISLPCYPPNTILVGHSFGGSIALLQSQCCHENIHAIIIMNCHFNVKEQMPYFPIAFEKVKNKVAVLYCKEDQQLPYNMVKIDCDEAEKKEIDSIRFKCFSGDHFSLFLDANTTSNAIHYIESFVKD